MKLYCSKTSLFFFALNILVNTHKKPSIITRHHTPIYTLRMLSEYDIQSSIYDKDADMKSVKERFDDRTSQRFQEFKERMKDKRQKGKEERDKNIQKIIEKDKREKSLAEKVEKGCLRCGCALGGVAASVGLFGGLGIYGWKMGALAAAEIAAKDTAMVEGLAAGAEAGKNAVIAGITEEFGVSFLGDKTLVSYITATNYNDVSFISGSIYTQYEKTCLSLSSGYGAGVDKSICISVTEKSAAVLGGKTGSVSDKVVIKKAVGTIVSDAETVATAAAKKASDEVIQRSIAVVDAKYVICQKAIIASVVALLIIVLVMIIIYLVLRYRRKKKMNKKAQYTKLLNQ
ncbi:rifin [Plasmodium reichenowi]|uniref:Rifin n=1 Tax=Plasmodium reichenowi TaxID=5854 RepID=A0A060RQT0_PLARE|nr:rifin [Plasmodium reichenowi]